MKEKENRVATVIPPWANDNDARKEAMEEAERHLSTIAKAIGRHIAREQFRAREQERRQQAANDNGQE